MNNNQLFPNCLKRWLDQKGIKVAELARRTGIQDDKMYRYNNEKQAISLPDASKIVRELQIEFEDLLESPPHNTESTTFPQENLPVPEKAQRFVSWLEAKNEKSIQWIEEGLDYDGYFQELQSRDLVRKENDQIRLRLPPGRTLLGRAVGHRRESEETESVAKGSPTKFIDRLQVNHELYGMYGSVPATHRISLSRSVPGHSDSRRVSRYCCDFTVQPDQRELVLFVAQREVKINGVVVPQGHAHSLRGGTLELPNGVKLWINVEKQ